MAIRVRRDGRMLCAAMHDAEPGDVYIDDDLHYRLSVELGVIVTEPFDKHAERGEWWCRNAVPPGVKIDNFYADNQKIESGGWRGFLDL